MENEKKTYTIRNRYMYTAILEVEASSEAEAIRLAEASDNEVVNNDDWLYDMEVMKVV